ELQKIFDRTSKAFMVEVNGKWGFDWNIPRGRTDAISTEVTALAFRTAQKINYTVPARVLADQLARITAENQGTLPEAVTPAGYRTDDKGLITGQNNYSIIQDKDGRWSRSPAAEAYLIDRPGIGPVQQQPQTISIKNDKTIIFSWRIFKWLVGGFFGLALAISGMGVGIWLVHRRKVRKVLEDKKGLWTDELTAKAAEEVYARDVLGAISKQAVPFGTITLGNSPIEINFDTKLRAIYKLVAGYVLRQGIDILSWRKAVEEIGRTEQRIERPLTATEKETIVSKLALQDSKYMRGLNEYLLIVAFFARRLIKDGAKDAGKGKTRTYDSNHIWSRLLMYHDAYYDRFTAALADGGQDKFDLVFNDMGARKREDQPVDLNDKAAPMPVKGILLTALERMNLIQNVIQNNSRTAKEKVILEAFGVKGGVRDNGAKNEEVYNYKRVTLPIVLDVIRSAMRSPAEREPVNPQVDIFINKFNQFMKTENLKPRHPRVLRWTKMLPILFAGSLSGVVSLDAAIGSGHLFTYFLYKMVPALVASPHFWLAAGLFGAATLLWIIQKNLIETYRFKNNYTSSIKNGLVWNWNIWEYSRHMMRAIASMIFIGAILHLPGVEGTVEFFKYTLAVPFVFEIYGAIYPMMQTTISRITQVAAVFENTTQQRSASAALKLLFRGRFLEAWYNLSPFTFSLLTRLNKHNFFESRSTSVIGESLRLTFSLSGPSGDIYGWIMSKFVYAGMVLGFMGLASTFMGVPVIGGWFYNNYLIHSSVPKMIFAIIAYGTALILARQAMSQIVGSIGKVISAWPLMAAAIGIEIATVKMVTPMLLGMGVAHPTALLINGLVTGILMGMVLLDKPLRKWL
ncbi:MAG: hypothetical protein KGJ11_09025, partial [Candidatus Omnitrophica bacterium]|nr:hypothetical protein [Candidatus Omnitrophota bacterium]